ncbi:TetR/AcrR family transcriptional regulator [Nocardioides humilatus]|uniref:TetR/AcrR family transcriptional regulator n=1 Tax=Nocardioides humilatus TaxID=2607660 RepID=A0A5B1LBB3_9ACTN|nr:TetR/AcrR family transcriptional regulator [Nocardioides humilatus]KAA1417060.1 TetR/AcrR family transcriptional regulator [Nocardioides humilatus]
MARMPLAQRRQQLVDAAIAVLTRDGVPKTTTRAIVAEAGTSLSVFHYCFDSKQELLDAVIKALVNTTVDLAEASFEAGATRKEMVRAGLEAYWSHVVANPDHHLLTYELTQYCLRTPGYAEVARQQYEHYSHAFIALLDGIGAKPALPPEVMGRYLAALIDGITLDWLVRRDDRSARQVLDLMAQQIDEVMLLPESTPA